MKLHSASFNDHERIPEVYTCEGKDVSPHLAWSDAPRDTRSFALVVEDPDAPAGTYRHWGVYDIPAEMTHIDEGFSGEDAANVGAKQVLNDFGHAGYGGPCPPPGHGEHHYRFELLALDVEHLDLPRGADVRALLNTAHPHILSRARLEATYSR
jgi:Raf kinase inhibitor-like YbhB/YbcL family protein